MRTSLLSLLPCQFEEGFEEHVAPFLWDWDGADIRVLGLASLDKEVGP